MSVRKLIVVFTAAAVVMLMAQAAGAAGITGTAHDVSSGNYTSCSMCHIPHGGSGGARLWPVPVATVGTLSGAVTSSLCGTCHISGGTYTGTFAGDSTNKVYGANSHGVRMTRANLAFNGTNTMNASTLPYTGTAYDNNTYIECTTCHNVHDDSNKPFLRAKLENLCQYCHSLRNYSNSSATSSDGNGAAFANWDNAQRQAGNPGSHPVGNNIDNVLQTSVPIVWPPQAIVKKQTGTTRNFWHLGGHLAGTDGMSGGMSCNTCHAVHGIEIDAGDQYVSLASMDPQVNMLIIGQRVSANNEGVTSGHSVANGDGDPNNALCEACHQGKKGVAYTTYFWNPGNTDFGHPVDGKVSTAGSLGVGDWSTLASKWPKASSTANGTDPICESCHSPHAKANAGRVSLKTAAGPYILRDSATLVCAECHAGGTLSGHHPTKAVGGVAGVTYLQSGGNLSCGTCHGGSGGSAHNWAAAGGGTSYPLASGWKPLNNARTDQFFGDGSTGAPYASTTCMDCHITLNGTTGNANPGTWAAAVGEYQIHGTGTHYIGPISSTFTTGMNTGYNLTYPSTTAFKATSQSWPLSAGGGTSYFSRFGGTSGAPILVCESCHNVAPSKNMGNNQLLLFPYVDGADNTFIQARSTLCEGCHGVPAGTHPQTGSTVGRTGAALSTAGSAWLVSTSPTNGPTMANGRVSCDSCHQPHSASTYGGTLILDYPSSGAKLIPDPGIADNTITLGGVLGGSGAVAHRRIKANNNLPDTSGFCAECHGYK